MPEFFGVLTGGDGDDVLQGSRAEGAVPVVYLDGGQGDDTLIGSDVDGYADVLLGQEGNDRLVGLRGPNRMEGGSGIDTLIGGFNNDTLLGGAGEDLLVGGEGFDTVSHADDPSGVQVNLGWRQQPVLVLPGSGEALQLSPNTLLADLPAELLALLSAMASRGFRRFDPSSSLANLLNELSVGEQALLPELADITTSNPVIWIPSDPNGTLVRLNRDALLRDVDSDVRTSIESALLRQGVSPRSTLSVVEASRLAMSSQLVDLGTLKLLATEVAAYAAHDGWGDSDRIETAIVDLPGSDVAEAALARDAARLLAVSTNSLQDLTLQLQQEWQTLQDAQDSGDAESLPATPLADEVRNQLRDSFSNAISDQLVQSGQSGDLELWLNDFAQAIATEQPSSMSSRAVAAALRGVLTQVENIEGSSFNDVLLGDSQHNTLLAGSGHDLVLGAVVMTSSMAVPVTTAPWW